MQKNAPKPPKGGFLDLTNLLNWIKFIDLLHFYSYMKRRVIERNMFYGAKKNIFIRALELRKNMTPVEKILWNELSKREIFKARFKSQHPISIFVVDFYCHRHKLVIEVDGEIHIDEEVMEYDNGRTYLIESLGIRILRFTNEEVINDTDLVINRILHEIDSLSPL